MEEEERTQLTRELIQTDTTIASPKPNCLFNQKSVGIYGKMNQSNLSINFSFDI